MNEEEDDGYKIDISDYKQSRKSLKSGSKVQRGPRNQSPSVSPIISPNKYQTEDTYQKEDTYQREDIWHQYYDDDNNMYYYNEVITSIFFTSPHCPIDV